MSESCQHRFLQLHYDFQTREGWATCADCGEKFPGAVQGDPTSGGAITLTVATSNPAVEIWANSVTKETP